MGLFFDLSLSRLQFGARYSFGVGREANLSLYRRRGSGECRSAAFYAHVIQQHFKCECNSAAATATTAFPRVLECRSRVVAGILLKCCEWVTWFGGSTECNLALKKPRNDIKTKRQN